jgi:hypothetical protein
MLKTIAGITVAAAVVAAGVTYARQATPPKFAAADYFEVADLYARYTRAVDMGGCWGDNDSCTPYKDVFATPEDGRANVAAFHQRIREEGWASRHSYASLLIEPTPEGAHGSVYALIYNVTAVPPFVDHSVYYDDTLVRTPRGWRFKVRRIQNNTQFKPSMPWEEPAR